VPVDIQGAVPASRIDAVADAEECERTIAARWGGRQTSGPGIAAVAGRRAVSEAYSTIARQTNPGSRHDGPCKSGTTPPTRCRPACCCFIQHMSVGARDR
jgi:hypothetical protein